MGPVLPPAGEQKKASDGKAQAQKGLKAVKKGQWKRSHKKRFNTSFHRPKTLKHDRAPKYPRQRWAAHKAGVGSCPEPVSFCPCHHLPLRTAQL